MAIRRDDFPLPDLTDEQTAPFYAGAGAGELRLPVCRTCGRFVWYPAATCPHCGGEGTSWVPTSGLGTLFTWAVVRRPFLSAFEEMVPFVTGLVALDEDPSVRIVTLIVDVEPDALVAEAPMQATFRPLRFPTVPDREVVAPMFRPR